MDPKTFWTFVLVLAAAMAYRYMPRWRARSPFVDVGVLKKKLDAGEDVVVLDVRTEGEFQHKHGHIPDAINLPLGDLEVRLKLRGEELADLKTHPIFVHCQGEARSARAARVLRDAGFQDVTVLKGGYGMWRRRKYPRVVPAPKEASEA